MKQEMNFRFLGGRHFYTKTPSGHDIHSDGSIESGGDDCAPRPMELMVAGLAGCTGFDVSSILEKMKVSFDDLSININLEKREKEPRIYTNIHLTYIFKGIDLPIKKLERAVNLSMEKYCTASAIFKQSAEITYEIKIV